MNLSYIFLLFFFTFARLLFGQDISSVQNDTIKKIYSFQIDSASELQFNMALSSYQNPILYDSVVFKKNEGVITLPILHQDSVFIVYRDTFFVQREAELEQYKYVGQFFKLGYYIVEAMFYEGAEIYLINKKNGVSNAFWTLPKLSYNKRFFANISTRDGIFPNGIQIWMLEKESLFHFHKSFVNINKLIQIDQEEWIPEEIVWTKDNVLLLKVLSVNNWLKINREQKDYFYLSLKLVK